VAVPRRRRTHGRGGADRPGAGLRDPHGISANTRAWWDLEPGRRLGYEPQDDAEAYADRIEPGPDDEAEAEFVGGPFATAQFHRPALGD
jgi:uronate dehydrogenase